MFDGEDLFAKERARLQAVQMREWSLAAQAEKAARLAEEKAADREYGAFLETVGKLRDGAVEVATTDAARRIAETKAYNQRMVRGCVE